jgi:hypothetical protein
MPSGTPFGCPTVEPANQPTPPRGTPGAVATENGTSPQRSPSAAAEPHTDPPAYHDRPRPQTSTTDSGKLHTE